MYWFIAIVIAVLVLLFGGGFSGFLVVLGWAVLFPILLGIGFMLLLALFGIAMSIAGSK